MRAAVAPDDADAARRGSQLAVTVFAVGGVASAAAFSAVAFGLIIGFFFYRDALDLTFAQTWALVGAFTANAFVAFLVGLGLYHWEQNRREREAARARARDAVAELASHDDLPALIKANRLQLEAYDVLVREQAATAFRNCQLALAGGFLVLVAAIGFAIVGDDVTSKAIAAGLSAVVGVLTSYLGKTFLLVHHETIKQLNRYSEQPVNTGYLLAAERAVTTSVGKDEQGPLVTEVVQRTLALLHAPAGADGDGDPATTTSAPQPATSAE